MKRIGIQAGEYKICNVTDELVLYTDELNSEIACSFFSVKLKKVALAREINNKQFKQLIEEFNPNNIIEPGLVKVRITGGDESQISKEKLDEIIKTLSAIDNNSNVIDIVACDTLHRFHPNSFELDCYHGHIIPSIGSIVSIE